MDGKDDEGCTTLCSNVTVLLSFMVELRRQVMIKSWSLCRSFPGVGWLL